MNLLVNARDAFLAASSGRAAEHEGMVRVSRQPHRGPPTRLCELRRQRYRGVGRADAPDLRAVLHHQIARHRPGTVGPAGALQRRWAVRSRASWMKCPGACFILSLPSRRGEEAHRPNRIVGARSRHAARLRAGGRSATEAGGTSIPSVEWSDHTFAQIVSDLRFSDIGRNSRGPDCRRRCGFDCLHSRHAGGCKGEQPRRDWLWRTVAWPQPGPL